ncbi:MAG TPA: DUF2892 domain-containing protein, partial [Albitalea sp.]|nr:DUF2892 domain-containing protein [Albitalea sp.]
NAMAPNLGIIDCLLRITLGLLLVALAIGGSIGAWGFAGIALLVSGTLWVCPAYRLLGIDTYTPPELRPDFQ